MIEIKLSWTEKMMAVKVGAARHFESVIREREDQHGFDGRDPWDLAIEGALGEIAAAKATGLYWDGSVNKFKYGADIGRDEDGIQVKTTKEHHYGLMIRPGDDDDKPFILVTGADGGPYQVHGWIYGGEAKREEWIFVMPPRPDAYLVPQENLNPLETLPGGISNRVPVKGKEPTIQ